MEKVALKIRRGQSLDLWDYKAWVEYNYLVFPKVD